MPRVMETRRRLVAVMVTDVVDSTAVAERLGPERSKFLFDEIVQLFEAEIARFGGTVAQHTGDGVLALFGAPAAHEDDSLRAVRAAWSLQQVFAAYSREVAGAYGVELAARVAVNTGPVVVLDGDDSADVIYNALGDTVNVAARLQSHARPGGVAVGPLTARQIAGHFALEPLGELELKGKTDLVAVFLVTGESRPAAAGSPFVGRRAEMEALEQVFGELLDGRGAIVSVTGEPGIGKSRLIGELRARFGDAVLFLEGAAVPYGTSIPYWPVREALRGWLDLGVADSEARTRLELKARLAEALGERAVWVQPFLARLLGVALDPAGEQRLHGLSPDSVQLQTFDAVRELVLALAREVPTCLVLDDLHWADDATLALVEGLFQTVDLDAVGIIAIYRSEREHAAWRLGDRARQRFPHRHLELQLRPLEAGQSRDLAVGSAGADVPPEIAELLAQRSGGNPFFLEEALRDLIERGALQRRNGAFVVAEDVDWDVPALVQEALQARLDRLSSELRELIGVASVIGHSFGMPLLERMLPGVPLSRLLADLQRLELVVEERRRPVAEYRFRHGLVREVAYGSLLEAPRRELHLAVGEALEELHGDTTQEVYGLLAYHFAEADAPAQAGRYLVAAADAARSAFATEEAIALYGRAVPFLDRIGDEQTARATLFKLGLTHHLAFDFGRANDAYAAAFARQAAARPPCASEGETLVVAVGTLRTDRADLTPGYTNEDWGYWIAEHLFRGLVSVDDELNVLPEVAAAFQVSTDGRRYRFELRDDAYWSDGTPVTADDFAFTWMRMRDEGIPTAHLLERVKRVEAIEVRTLEVELTGARSYALYLFGYTPFFPWPRHIVEQQGADWYRADVLVSNGPFVLAELDDQHGSLRANPTWYGPRGNINQVKLQFTTARDAIKAWRSGRLDIGLAPPERGLTHVHRAKGMSLMYLGYRVAGSPLADIRLRRALGHALNRDAIFPDWLGEAGSGGLIPPSLPAHSHNVAPPFDPAQARQLLAEAGFPGGHGLRPLRLISMNLGISEPPDRAIAQWAELGVSVDLERLPADLFDATLENPNAEWDLYWDGWITDYPDPEGMLDTLLAWSPAIHVDDDLIELLAAARSSANEEERLRLYRTADQRLVRELASVTPLWYGENTMVTRPWVDGARLGPLRPFPLLDEVNIRR